MPKILCFSLGNKKPARGDKFEQRLEITKMI